jgi:hypothetical protein
MKITVFKFLFSLLLSSYPAKSLLISWIPIKKFPGTCISKTVYYLKVHVCEYMTYNQANLTFVNKIFKSE